MLNEEVVNAVEQRKFHIYAVNTIDEGIELLTGVKAGKRSKAGKFEPNTVHGRVDKRLLRLAEQAVKFAEPLKQAQHLG
jgi:predicted ATP-dependent protease